MREDIRVKFGRRRRKLRKQRSWTQVQMAERLGLDRSYLAHIERGKRNLSLVNLELIATGFGRTVSQLFSQI